VQHGTSQAARIIRAAVADGSLPVQEMIVRGAERLDTIAGTLYGDGRYWWILASTSNIGWSLQVAPGTIIKVPELAAIAQLVG